MTWLSEEGACKYKRHFDSLSVSADCVFVVLVFQETVDLLLWRLRLRETQTEVEESVSRVITPFPGQLTINQREQSGKGVLEQKKRLHLLEKHLFL